MTKTKFLPSLDNMTYESFEDDDNQEVSKIFFDMETKLIFKRTPLSIQIVKRESDNVTKYELFDRLNSGGSPLSGQEIRNAIFLMENPPAIKFIKKLAKDKNFIEIISLTDRQLGEAFNDELILRFFVYSQNSQKVTKSSSVKKFLDSYLRDDLKSENMENLEKQFQEFFKFLNLNFNYEVFRRKNKRGNVGEFKISKFESLVIGLSPYMDTLEAKLPCLKILNMKSGFKNLHNKVLLQIKE